MIGLFVKRLAVAVVVSHVAVTTGLHFYKKSRKDNSLPSSSAENFGADEQKLLKWRSNFKGISMSTDYEVKEKELLHLDTRESDILVVSYPKSGTTWLSEIVYNIVNDMDFTKARSRPIDERVPFLEWLYPKVSDINAIPHSETRVMKTHIPYKILPDNLRRCRIVYISRNPRDVAVSYYNFTKMVQPLGYHGKFSGFLKLFNSGQCVYGPWWSHVTDYWNVSQESPEKVLFITYEQLSQNPVETIQKIAKFLKRPFKSGDEAKLIAHYCSFEKMKTNKATDYKWLEDFEFKRKDMPFYRAGKVGSWRQYFNEELLSNLKKEQTDNIKDGRLLSTIVYVLDS